MSTQPEARFVREGDWLVVRVTGAIDADRFVGIVAQIAAAQRGAPAAAVLVDMHETFGSLDDLDRYRVAMAAVSQGLAGPIALVGNETIIDPQRFGEVVARNRGVNVRVFFEEPGAREWLRGQTGEATPP